jgi:hypothetical protein
MRNEIKLEILHIAACEEEEKRMLRDRILRGQTICHGDAKFKYQWMRKIRQPSPICTNRFRQPSPICTKLKDNSPAISDVCRPVSSAHQLKTIAAGCVALTMENSPAIPDLYE